MKDADHAACGRARAFADAEASSAHEFGDQFDPGDAYRDLRKRVIDGTLTFEQAKALLLKPIQEGRTRHMTRSIIDVIGRSEALKLMGDAVLKAVEEDKRLGLPKGVQIDGVLYKQFVDGSLERFGPTGSPIAKPLAPIVTK
ncbi:hypothetical protein GmRootV59_16050 [Variovorax sp. V59]|uniref:hypothetical protein n=1 Tax=unclassified Variovorax TaxID=663243 RepID=UPI0034E8BA01